MEDTPDIAEQPIVKDTEFTCVVDANEIVSIDNSELVNAIALLGDRVAGAMASLENTTSVLIKEPSWVSTADLLFPLFVAFIGAFSAYLFNLFHWETVKKKEKISSIGNALFVLIDEFESMSIYYWNESWCAEKRDEISTKEIQMKSKVFLMSKYIDLVTSQLKRKGSNELVKNLNSFRSEIFDVATGDGFETVTRVASKSKAMCISKMCAEIKIIISMI